MGNSAIVRMLREPLVLFLGLYIALLWSRVIPADPLLGVLPFALALLWEGLAAKFRGTAGRSASLRQECIQAAEAGDLAAADERFWRLANEAGSREPPDGAFRIVLSELAAACRRSSDGTPARHFAAQVRMAAPLAIIDPIQRANGLAEWASLLHEQGDPSEAEPLARDALGLREAHLAAGDPAIAESRELLAAVLREPEPAAADPAEPTSTPSA